MKKPRISCIAAIGATTRALGKENKLLWRIPDDLKRFKELTTGHPIIMGRKTFESIGRALPNRTNIIVTRNHTFTTENCLVTHSFDEALAEAQSIEEDEVFVIGGAEIYTLALPHTDRLYLTLVESGAAGDTFFPDYSEFTKKISEKRFLDAAPPYSYVILEK